MVVLSGERAWCHQQIETLQPYIESALLISQDEIAGIKATSSAQAQQYLGQEIQNVVFDAWSGFGPDAMGAISGTLKAGGLFYLLTPAFDEWPQFDDPEHQRITVPPFDSRDVGRRFIHYVIDELSQCMEIVRYDQQQGVVAASLAEQVSKTQTVSAPYKTDDQRRAVEALIHVVKGHRRRPAVLTADRGRGKSTALALAAYELMQHGYHELVITAPRMSAVDAVFDYFEQYIADAEVKRGQVTWQGARLRFMPPDELLAKSPRVEMVFVDEAASIPASMLEKMVRHHSRIAFATTVHGYEGTGRGFELRFKQTLSELCPQWKAVELYQPIRWAENDPLEQVVNKLLLLDVDVDTIDEPIEVEPSQLHVLRLERDELVRNKALLSQLFALLVNAHYRTRPYDLRQMLDGPNLDI
ncbi:MAG: tRNA(Met) cytidine acetyltransferase, partial [Gammaproteobacteria bacterium]|nr:tRNA(Met) cytidine acetyltransferase [Gammaproteobacteria bacterium]